MQSDKVKRVFDVYNSDKYKHRMAYPGNEKYADTEPIEHYIQLRKFFYVLICDPPYSEQGGGHNANNANLKKAKGFMNQNERFGVGVTYTRENILAMFVEIFEHSRLLLKSGGYLLLKLKDYDGVPMENDAATLAHRYGLTQVGKFIFANKNLAAQQFIIDPKQHSTMLVFRKNLYRPKVDVQFQDGNANFKVMMKSNEQYQSKYVTEQTNRRDAEFKLHKMVACLSINQPTIGAFSEAMKQTLGHNNKEHAEFLKVYKLTGKKKQTYFDRLKSNGRLLRDGPPAGQKRSRANKIADINKILQYLYDPDEESDGESS